jgi:hypothetical protein
VAVYVLGRPATLQLVDTRTEHADTVARDIGRSLVPSGLRAVSFDVRQPNGRFLLERLTLDAATGKSQIARIAELPNGAEFVAWTPRGDAITSSGTTLYSLRPGESTWRTIGDFATDGLRDISRLAVSPNGHWLAIVAMPR